MGKLAESKCVPYRGNIRSLTEDEIAALKPQVAEWEIVVTDGTPRLERAFEFKDFAQALAFTDQVGEIAESEGHHPALLTEWGRVTVSWWTHKIEGLHKNDFIMAAKTDVLYGGQESM